LGILLAFEDLVSSWPPKNGKRISLFLQFLSTTTSKYRRYFLENRSRSKLVEPAAKRNRERGSLPWKGDILSE
jgi:hypothetical protein